MRYVRLFLLLFFVSLFQSTEAQNPDKKILGHEELVSWNQIENTKISYDGQWLMYTLKKEEGDPTLMVRNLDSKQDFSFERGSGGHFSADNNYVVFLQAPHQDSIKSLRRQKVKDKELPKDTLVILELASQNIQKIPRVRSYQLPGKWAGWLAYHKEPALPDTSKAEKDSTAVEIKKENKENGSQLVIMALGNDQSIAIDYVTDYRHAKDAAGWIIKTTGGNEGSDLMPGILFYNGKQDQATRVYADSSGTFGSIAISRQGDQLAFLAHSDTTKPQIPPYELFYWKENSAKAQNIANQQAAFMPDQWILNEHSLPYFSEDGGRLFFGLAPEPILQDTNLLDEEIVQVEVWSYQDERLYPQQLNQLENDKKRAWQAVWNVNTQAVALLQEEKMDQLLPGNEGNATYGIAYDQSPYYHQVSWEGFPSRRDLFRVNLQTGEQELLAEALKGGPSMSPAGKYAYWFSYSDTTWQGIRLADKKHYKWTDNNGPNTFYREEHDTPSVPGGYGVAGWLENDRMVLVYDRYDIWLVDPAKPAMKRRITKGREDKVRYRYIRLDPEQRFINEDQLLLQTFSETDKTGGFAWLDLNSGNIQHHHFGDYLTGRRPLKARDADRMVFTLENFQTFPDLRVSGSDFESNEKVSDANPQQADYSWGNIELYEWTSLDGKELQGMLVLPEGFDPAKQYPMIVNFYEKSSDGLMRHRAPYPHRSTINYAFYASRGYIIFNPDVPYRNGYPGESAYNSVIAGVTSLMEEGFVDRDRIGVQGHSWGGYQIAYLVTKTDIFRCAESGAPVVNMTSAYGGIRWGSGLSRMFQYEHTQSRVGGTLWGKPLRYLENSPIFFVDKINTPVLILHNDKDGAVPWYQGIEWFVAMRRLNKPAWMLNYNNEPHWPLKLQNRKDFNIRMAQFFDYYLMDQPMPQWMERGVPAMEKGILQGID